jgi:gliding motility-associated-like protein
MKKILFSCLLITIIACKKKKLGNALCDCAQSPDTMITDSGTVRIPQIFTPNGDGANDLWIIRMPESPKSGTLRIIRPGWFNKEIISSDFATSPGFSWDGHNAEGTYPDGKYKYELTVDGFSTEGYVCLYTGGLEPKSKDCLKDCETYNPLINDQVLN